MSTTRTLLAATLATLFATAHAATGQDVNLDGSTKAHRKPTLATQADKQLRSSDVPSVKSEPVDVKAQADADMAARDARAKAPRVHVERQNLKGDAAAQAIKEQTNANTIDRSTAYGDKDHTEQVTNLKFTIKK